jgi:hypothetical protein
MGEASAAQASEDILMRMKGLMSRDDVVDLLSEQARNAV